MDQVFHCGCLILHLSENTGAVMSVIGDVEKTRREEQMATLDEIGEEKQRIS